MKDGQSRKPGASCALGLRLKEGTKHMGAIGNIQFGVVDLVHSS